MESFCEQLFLHIQVIRIVEIPCSNFIFSKAFLHQKYVEEGLTSGEIAHLTFSSRSTVTKHLKLFKIPLKTETRRTNGAGVFGFQKRKGRVIERKIEREVIQFIGSLREQGKSYQAIADCLNENGVKTKKKVGRWFPKVVRQIHLRETASRQDFFLKLESL